jgi:hypothetical protein
MSNVTRLWLVVSALFICNHGPAAAVPVQKQVNLIEIRTGWGGLGASQSATVTIRRERGVFLNGGRTVSPLLVQALVDALETLPISEPEAANFGITQQWLKMQVTRQKPRARIQAIEPTAGQRALFAASFTDPAIVATAVKSLFAFRRFDDYPGVRVEITFEDGTRRTAQSRSYFVFMVPWNIDGLASPTYNADISRAVSALLPDKTVNKERLSGRRLETELTEAVMNSIETQWNLRGAEETVGGALALLRTKYQIVETEIGPWHDAEFGTATYKGEPEEMNLHAAVRKNSFPPSLTHAVVLRQVKGRVEGVEAFLKAGGAHETRVLSVPWLNKYMDAHPQTPVRISYVQDASFGDKALRTYVADMTFRGREDLVAQARAQHREIVLLIAGAKYAESYWLLFPDNHMVLWRYNGPTGLLSWRPEDFSNGKCAEYEPPDGGCSGREITADGVLAAAHANRDQECMSQ